MSGQQGAPPNSPAMPPDSNLPSSCPSAPMELDDYLKIYSAFRDYTKQEDKLILGRLGSVLTIHGFLYAAYGFTIQKKLEISEKMSEFLLGKSVNEADCLNTIFNVNKIINQNDVFMICVAMVGFSISILGILSIASAVRAAEKLRNIFDKQFESFFDIKYNTFKFEVKNKIAILPSITGGGSKTVTKISYIAPLGIPSFLALSWIISFMWLLNNSDINFYNLFDWHIKESLSCKILKKYFDIRLQ